MHDAALCPGLCRHLFVGIFCVAAMMASATMAQPTTKRSLRSAAAPPTKVDIEAASWSGRITHVSPFVTEEEEARRRLQTLGTGESRAAANMTRLIADLLDGYDRQVPPLGTTVRVQLALQSIPTFDTQTQTIEIYGWWRYYWTDHRLAWSKDDYGGIEEATMFYNVGGFNSVWAPDMYAYEALSRFENFPDAPIPPAVSVYSDGSCYISRPVLNKFFCAMEVQKFPFDEQACEITVGSWSYHGLTVDLKPRLSGLDDEGTMSYDPIDVSPYISNSEFKLVKVQTSHTDNFYACCTEPFPVISYRFWLKRYPSSYVTATILPLILATFCGILGLFMNPDSGERLGLMVTVLLAQAVLYATAVGFLPKTSIATFIQEMYLISTAICSYLLMESIIAVSLYTTKPSEDVLSEPALWQAFLEADSDHSGTLERDELKRAIDQLGLSESKTANVMTQTGRHFDKLDNGISHAITFEEWMDVVAEVYVEDGFAQYHNFIVSGLVRFFLPVERMHRKKVVMRRLAGASSSYTNFEDDMELEGCLGLLTKSYRRSKEWHRRSKKCVSPRPLSPPMMTTPEGQQDVLSRNVMRVIDVHEGAEYPDHMKGGVSECKGDALENSENPMRSKPEVHRGVAPRANAAEEEGVSVEIPTIITERELKDPAQKIARKIAGWLAEYPADPHVRGGGDAHKNSEKPMRSKPEVVSRPVQRRRLSEVCLSEVYRGVASEEEGVSADIPKIITERELTDPAQKIARQIAGWLDSVSALFVIIAYICLLLWIYAEYSVYVDDAGSMAGERNAKLTHYAGEPLPPVGNALK